MAKQYGPPLKGPRPPSGPVRGKGENQRRIRFYARNIRRKYPQLGAQLAQVAQQRVERTQRALRLAGAVKAIALVAIACALFGLQCMVRR